MTFPVNIKHHGLLRNSFLLFGTLVSTRVFCTMADLEYPGTADSRLEAVRARVKEMPESDFNQDWIETRRNLLFAGGLRDIDDERRIGSGYTGHSFNDFNHCDLTTMRLSHAHNENDGSVQGIAIGNALGKGIESASLPMNSSDDHQAGSWTTCMLNCNLDPPQDVAHIQFRSRIAFKLVWVPPNFEKFVLVDDNGSLLKIGKPLGVLPDIRHRQANFQLVQGSKYATAAMKLEKDCEYN